MALMDEFHVTKLTPFAQKLLLSNLHHSSGDDLCEVIIRLYSIYCYLAVHTHLYVIIVANSYWCNNKY